MSYRIIQNGEDSVDGSLPESCAMDVHRTSKPPDGDAIFASLAEAKRAAVKELNDYIKSIPGELRYIRNQIRALTPATVTEGDDARWFRDVEYDEEE